MQKYADVVLDRKGNVVPGATVRVKTRAGTDAVLYSNNGTGPISNPITTDSLGRFAFYAENGRYNLQVYIGSALFTVSNDILLEDPMDETPEVIKGGTIKDVALLNVTIDGKEPGYKDDTDALDLRIDDVDGRWCGVSVDRPAKRLDNSTLQVGDECQDPDDERFYWSGAEWISFNSSAQQLKERLADPEYGAKEVALPYGTVSNAIKYLTPEMFGALGAGVDDPSIFAAAVAAQLLTGLELRLAKGRSYVAGLIVNTSDTDINWVGEGTIVFAEGTSAIDLSSTSVLVGLAATISKGARQIPLTDTAGLKPGSLIYVETSMDSCSPYGNIGVRQTFTVAAKLTDRLTADITGNLVTVCEPSEWTFRTTDTGLKVIAYKNPRMVRIKGVEFRRDQNILTRALSVTGCRYVFDDLYVWNTVAPDPDNGQDGILINRCNAGISRNPRLKNLRYGITIGDGGMNNRCENVTADLCRHGVQLNGWPVNTYVSCLRGHGNTGIMDSHASLNTTYEDVYATGDRGLSNCRGDGATLRNIKIFGDNTNVGGDGIRVAMIQWNEAYAEQRNSRDTVMDEVKFVYSDGAPSTKLTVGYCRIAKLTNVEFQPIVPCLIGGSPGNISELHIENFNLDLSPEGTSIVRTPTYSAGKGNRGRRLNAVTSNGADYLVSVYPDGVVGDMDLSLSGLVFRDSVSVATRTFNLKVQVSPRPLNYDGVASVQGVLRLRITTNSFSISEFSIPFQFKFTGGALGASTGAAVGVPITGDLTSLTVGSPVSVTATRVWAFTLPFTLPRTATNQVFSVTYSIEAQGLPS